LGACYESNHWLLNSSLEDLKFTALSGDFNVQQDEKKGEGCQTNFSRYLILTLEMTH